MRASEHPLLCGRVAERRKMAKRKRSSEIRLHPRTTPKHERDAREVANARRLDKLPPELWVKILDHLESDDLFPLALSCRYFRQKQKELVARPNCLKCGKPCLALVTSLERKGLLCRRECRPASAEYLRFCYKEKEETSIDDDYHERVRAIRDMAAFHGYLPLLQEIVRFQGSSGQWCFTTLGLADFMSMATFAGEFSLQSSLLFPCLFRLLTSFSRSARRSAGDLAVAKIPEEV